MKTLGSIMFLLTLVLHFKHRFIHYRNINMIRLVIFIAWPAEKDFFVIANGRIRAQCSRKLPLTEKTIKISLEGRQITSMAFISIYEITLLA